MSVKTQNGLIFTIQVICLRVNDPHQTKACRPFGILDLENCCITSPPLKGFHAFTSSSKDCF
ncbi:uncharacterized protein PHALS_02140 [Plasmopara halstedii]|uniref:Uncharacterized protein n=1 Tax=Plasmopara halstedii TaxID=4781 RepID=A0A0N7L722_PLAHL|nr:uncharacterized protein PHALS_02140 [Plasmopara halstedii]CEG45867.1 hypothetical protein PHALS_02140 [Plasmopara halstedii]|eukprot:XP_024582236.1 hypothetical protein PHALS_02140 [Plasmopara halstedii]